jgi:hypothetical protein
VLKTWKGALEAEVAKHLLHKGVETLFSRTKDVERWIQVIDTAIDAVVNEASMILIDRHRSKV